MRTEIKFDKQKLLLAILILACFLAASVYLVSATVTDSFPVNTSSKAKLLGLLGVFGVVYFPMLLFSMLKLFTRKHAIILTDEFLTDYSRYESLGAISWSDIANISRLEKKSIEITLSKRVLRSSKRNLLQRFLGMMHNWNYKESIVVSSALLDCSIVELYKMLSEAYSRAK